MRVTLRGIDPKLWVKVKIESAKTDKPLGKIVNEALELRLNKNK